MLLWSKHGFIAYANPILHVTYLESVDGQRWKLAPPRKIHPTPVSMVSWSHPSTDLAVADSQGNFYIYLAGVGLLSKGDTPSYELTSYSHTEMIYQDLEIKLPIVGFKWLHVEKAQIHNHPATRDSSTKQFTYLLKQTPPHGATHPILTKQACMTLRRNGQVTLYYQGEHKVEYHRIDCEPCTDVVNITHGAIGFANDGRVIVAMLDSLTSTITTHAITIDWGFLKELAKRQKENPHYNTPENAKTPPKLTLEVLSSMTLAPGYVYDDDSDTTRCGELFDVDLVGCTPTSDLSLLVTYNFQDDTRVLRYQIALETATINPAFKQLAERKGRQGTAPVKPTQVMQLVGEITRPGRVDRIDEMDHWVVFIYGSRIDVFNRDMVLVNGGNNQPEPAFDFKGGDDELGDLLGTAASPPKSSELVTTIGSLFDVGYNFDIVVHPTPPEMLALSPTLALYVAFYDGHPQLHPVSRSNPPSTKNELYEMAVAFAHHHATACYANCCCDDLVILIQLEMSRVAVVLPPDVVVLILAEAHKAINFALDGFTREQVDKLISNPPLQKLMLLQLALGEATATSLGRGSVGDIAWVVLNLRLTLFGIMFLLLSIYAQISKKKPTEDLLADLITRGERIMLLIGLVKWFIDLMVYIYQELFQLLISRTSGNLRLTMSNLLALPIILAKVPRLFLMYALLLIGKTHEILKKLHKDLADANKLYTPMKEALNRYFTVVTQAPLALLLFENYLRECDAYITKELAVKTQSNTDPLYILRLEQKLVCQGELSPEMTEIANVLLDRHQVNLNRHMKISEVYFYDVDWLCVGVANPAPRMPHKFKLPVQVDPLMEFMPRLPYASGECVDALRKIVISRPSSNSRNLRKCTRCRAVSLVADPMVFDAPSTIGLWTMVFQRTCICGNLWVNC